MHRFEVLRRPLITEKSSLLQEQNKFVFEVAPTANKVQVKEAVERAFNVKVRAVNIIQAHGAERRMGPRRVRVRGVKKAVVTLRSGDTISLFEGA